jgi:hypothetical protein
MGTKLTDVIGDRQRLHDKLDRLQQQADVRQQQIDVRLQQADVRLQQADGRLQEADVRRKQADVILQQLDANCQQLTGISGKNPAAFRRCRSVEEVIDWISQNPTPIHRQLQAKGPEVHRPRRSQANCRRQCGCPPRRCYCGYTPIFFGRAR